ncbi:unnamed protein product [Cuscuta campestris]|uniref:DUF7769 domain-containing protein n=1 Tax=Cuscuta campestris TaxID=132261 RepID=A0A484N0J4_9ASTE|nr:unnamed protein product [Cuscuta campestris]
MPPPEQPSSPSSLSTHDSSSLHHLPDVIQVPFDNLFTPAAETEAQSKGAQLNQKRRRVADVLLEKSKDGKLQHGLISKVAEEFSFTRKTVSNIWQIVKAQLDFGLPIDVQCHWKGSCGKKRVPVDMEKLAAIPLSRRKNMRALSFAMEVSKSTVHRWLKRILYSSVRSRYFGMNTLSPFVFSDFKCLDHISPQSLPISPTFHDFYDHIHIDEKWFEITKKNTTFYALPEEPDPYRTTQSKSFIPKIMFLAAVGRPRYGEGGDVLWDGKIGIFPFTFEQEAQRSSKNRPAGTLETKAEPTVNRDVMKRMLLTNLIPAIKQKWPGSSRDIIIQQDNAKPHVDGNDPEIVAAAQEGDWNIQLKFQPPNSPDLNVHDLGFFRSIDSVQDQTAPRSLTDLVKPVTTAFEELSHDKLNNVFLTLQGVMGEILSHNGGNQFKIPHMGKSKLARQGILPQNLGVSTEVYENAQKFL